MRHCQYTPPLPIPLMTSPAKRPAVTYNRSRKIPNTCTESLSLNPDAALQQKINDLLFSKKENNPMTLPEEEFDSAYHETSGNAKKVHDLLQVGETRRFVDEIEYLLDGLQASGPKSLPTIQASLQEIVSKCFKKGSNAVDLAFGMKLKSHGALETIFEAVQELEDLVVFDNLLLLVAGLLYDVRRLDFFFTPQLAIKLARHCMRVTESNDALCHRLKGTQVFTNLEGIESWNGEELYEYLGIWILFKCSFSSLTTRGGGDNNANDDSVSFFDLLAKETELLGELIKTAADLGAKREIREKSASLLDCLLNRKNFVFSSGLDAQLTDLLKDLISGSTDLVFMKLAVSLSGSEIGKNYFKAVGTETFFASIQALMKILIQKNGDDTEILALSAFINLIDRCDDSVMDEFRYQKFEDDASLLQTLTVLFNPANAQKSLLALALGFICRQNQTNIQVMCKTAGEELVSSLKEEIYSVSSEFLLRQENDCGDMMNDGQLINDRLKEIVLTFKAQQQ